MCHSGHEAGLLVKLLSTLSAEEVRSGGSTSFTALDNAPLEISCRRIL